MPALLVASRSLAGKGRAGFSIHWIVALAGIGVAIVCRSGAIATTVSPAARASLAVTAVAVGLWASEVVPLPVTALVAVSLLVVTGATPTP